MSVVVASGDPPGGARGGRPSPAASVVVAVHGNPGDLPGLVATLNGQTMPLGMFELVVVDNHRWVVVDPSVFTTALFGWRLVHEPAPGLSRARNAGIRSAAGDCVLITDADSRPDSSWVQALAGALLEEDAFAAGGPAIPRLPVAATLHPALRQWFVPPTWPETTQELAPPYWIIGCNMGFRRTNPPWTFDEELGTVGRRHRSCEDLEFVIRAQAAGLRVLLVPDAVVHRAITAGDLRLRALLGRAFWHGVSVARLRRKVAARYILDSYRIRDVIAEGDLLTRLTHLARIAGYHGGRFAALLRSATEPPDTTPLSHRTVSHRPVENRPGKELIPMSEPVAVGLNLGHDGGCAIICGNTMVAIAEERLNRTRYSAGWHASLAYCLEAADLDLADVDIIVFSSVGPRLPAEFTGGLDRYGVKPSSIVSVDHHLSHAYTALCLSGFDDALVVVADGSGWLWRPSATRRPSSFPCSRCASCRSKAASPAPTHEAWPSLPGPVARTSAGPATGKASNPGTWPPGCSTRSNRHWSNWSAH